MPPKVLLSEPFHAAEDGFRPLPALDMLGISEATEASVGGDARDASNLHGIPSTGALDMESVTPGRADLCCGGPHSVRV